MNIGNLRAKITKDFSDYYSEEGLAVINDYCDNDNDAFNFIISDTINRCGSRADILLLRVLKKKLNFNDIDEELNAAFTEKLAEIQNKKNLSCKEPFDFVKRCDPAQLLRLLLPELPQTIAVVLSYLEPDKAAVLLQNFPQEVQGEVAKRVAMLNVIEPDTIMVIKKILEKKLLTAAQGVTITPGGIDSIVEIINLVDRASEIQIIKMLEEEDPELAEEIKNRMFTFDDIVMLDDRAIQKVLREIDNKDVLAKALKGADMNVQNKIFKNLTKHAAETLKEDLESIGPVLLRDVENAQSQIVSIIRNLEEKGEIVPVSEGDLAV